MIIPDFPGKKYNFSRESGIFFSPGIPGKSGNGNSREQALLLLAHEWWKTGIRSRAKEDRGNYRAISSVKMRAVKRPLTHERWQDTTLGRAETDLYLDY